MKIGGVALALAFLAACDRSETAPSRSASTPEPVVELEPAVAVPKLPTEADTGPEPVVVPANAITEPRLATEADAELARLRQELEQRDARIHELELQVAKTRDDRVEREREWLEYTQTIARLTSIAGAQHAHFEPAQDPTGAPRIPATGDVQAPPTMDAAGVDREAALRQREAEIRTSLRALLAAEQVSGIEILETGRLADGAVGPVVLRATDDRGRTVGTICAERLRLEASIAARSVTIVLEDGYERRGNERIPFPPSAADPTSAAVPSPDASLVPLVRSGRRRFELDHVDPRPWIEAVPEIFRAVDRAPPPNDGRWNLLSVRAALNLLLRQDVEAGVWRLAGLGGVEGDVLRDVQLDQLDADGAIERKLFADRMRVFAEERGVRIELESGAVLRGDSKTPFLEGRYRIFLPRADVAEWRTAGVPGLSPPPARK